MERDQRETEGGALSGGPLCSKFSRPFQPVCRLFHQTSRSEPSTLRPDPTHGGALLLWTMFNTPGFTRHRHRQRQRQRQRERVGSGSPEDPHPFSHPQVRRFDVGQEEALRPETKSFPRASFRELIRARVLFHLDTHRRSMRTTLGQHAPISQ